MRLSRLFQLERAAGGHAAHALAAPEAVDGALARLVPIAIGSAIFEPNVLRELQRLQAIGFMFHAEELLVGGIDARVPFFIELAHAHDDVMGVAVAASLNFG